MPHSTELTGPDHDVVVTVDAFRTAVLAVLPFVDPDHQVAFLGGVRVAVIDDDVAVVESASAAGAAQYRVPCEVLAGRFDRVLPYTEVVALLGFVQTPHTSPARVRFQHVDDALSVVVVEDVDGTVSTVAGGTYPGDAHPATKTLRAAVKAEREPGVFDVHPDTLRALSACLSTTGHRCVIYPGAKNHLATSGDEFIAVVAADHGGRSRPTAWFQTNVPSTPADLSVWADRL